jgi:phosphonate transport system substrate-binding protein
MTRKLAGLAGLLALAVTLAACGAAAPAAQAPTVLAEVAPTAAAVAPTVAAAATAVAPAATEAPAATAAATQVAQDRTGWPETFRIGLFGGDDANAVMNNAEPFRVLLEERLGIPVELQTGTSYSAVIEAMRAGRVDAMEVGPFAYVLAVEEAGAEALAVGIYPQDEENPVYDPDAPSFYYSVYFTKKGSGIETLEDLRGTNFAFVDPASTSGHLAPKTGLLKAGINPDEEMETVFAGSHPTAVLSVWNDNTVAGATFEGNLYRLANEGQIELCGFPDGRSSVVRTPEEIQAVYDACPEGHIVILGFSDPIPNTPFAVNSELPDSFKAAVTELLLEVKDNPELVASLKQWYAMPPEELNLATVDSYYNSLRDIARLLDLDLNELAR